MSSLSGDHVHAIDLARFCGVALASQSAASSLDRMARARRAQSLTTVVLGQRCKN